MISTYSDRLVVTGKAVKTEIVLMDDGREVNITYLEVMAEMADLRDRPEIPIAFFGDMAKKAHQDLKPGSEFTYRGMVIARNGQPRLVALKYNQVPKSQSASSPREGGKEIHGKER